VQPTLILLVSRIIIVRPIKVNFLSFRLLGEAIMLQVQAASCPYTVAYTFNIPSLPIILQAKRKHLVKNLILAVKTILHTQIIIKKAKNSFEDVFSKFFISIIILPIKKP